MSDMLCHLSPREHREADFAAIIRSIPKTTQEHIEQLKYLRARVACGWKVRRVLDVGCGEGTFTKVALELLVEAGALVDGFELDLIEKDPTLAARSVATLVAGGKQIGELPLEIQTAGLRGAMRHLRSDGGELLKLPGARDELRLTLDELRRTRGCYDLIIASHVSYYFENAGLDLAYLLCSRLLQQGKDRASTGGVWFVVRDRKCPFYRNRERLLNDRPRPLADANRDSFSDALIDGLRCWLADNGQGAMRALTCQTRTMRLALGADPQVDQIAIEYLYWLSGLTSQEIERAVQAGDHADGFSESHMWLIPTAGEMSSKQEDDMLNAAKAIRLTIDQVRRTAADLETHYAEVGLVRAMDPQSLEDVSWESHTDMESAISEKGLTVTNFGFRSLLRDKPDLLAAYFGENTTHLFYPRFYHDYVTSFEDGTNGTTRFADLSTVLLVNGRPLLENPCDYPIRMVDTGAQEMRIPAKKPKPFSTSVTDWTDMVSRAYCEGESCERGPRMWSINIGFRASPSIQESFTSKEPVSCAVFMVVASRQDLEALARTFVGQIKNVLGEWLVQRHYHRVLQEMRHAVEEADRFRALTRVIMHELNGDLGLVRSGFAPIDLTLALATLQGMNRHGQAPGRTLQTAMDALEIAITQQERLPMLMQTTHYKIMAFSRWQSGKEPKPEEYVRHEVGKLVNTVCEWYLGRVRDRDYQLEASEDPVWVTNFSFCEAEAEFCLSLLLRNAFQHRVKGTQVRISAMIQAEKAIRLEWRNESHLDREKDLQESEEGSPIAIRGVAIMRTTCRRIFGEEPKTTWLRKGDVLVVTTRVVIRGAR